MVVDADPQGFPFTYPQTIQVWSALLRASTTVLSKEQWDRVFQRFSELKEIPIEEWDEHIKKKEEE